MARVPAVERRADLVDAAVRVIASRGVDGATTRRIAEEAKAPLATLHYCFASKELLFQEVLHRVAVEYRDVLARSNRHADIATAAREMLRAMMVWYLESPDYGAATIELISWAQRQEGESAVVVYNETFDMMRSILEEGAAGQGLSSETIEELTYVIGALADGFGMNWLTFADRPVAFKQMETAVAVLDAWLATKLGNVSSSLKPSADFVPEASVLTSCPG